MALLSLDLSTELNSPQSSGGKIMSIAPRRTGPGVRAPATCAAARWIALLLVVLATACSPTSSAPPTPPPATQAPLGQPPTTPPPATQSALGQLPATPGPATQPPGTQAAASTTAQAAPATISSGTAAAPPQSTAASLAPTTVSVANTAATAAPTANTAATAAPTANIATTALAKPGAAKPATTIVVKGAYAQASSVQGALYVAREKGFFANHGLDVQLSQVGGTQQVAALLSGELQFGALGANEVANADIRGADLVMIATCSDLPIFSLYANKKYTSVAQLAGQSIGVTTAGSATDAAAHLFLKQFNMLDSVKILPAGGTVPAILAAMDQSNIAGGVLSPPTTSRADDAGYLELVNGASLGVPMNHSGIAVSRSYLKDHADEVKNFLAAYQEAWMYAANPANKADVVAVLVQYTQSDDRLGEISYQAMVPIWTGSKTPRVNPQAVANLLQVSGVPEAASANPDQFFDDSLMDSIAPPA
ncbi:MAG: ABC transporter substrate-binding protein [Chloroflexi bacterium]|nr:ABC transporter substrate-binding protein [Chloroflexota bacterium]